jgi:hypothetical protein
MIQRVRAGLALPRVARAGGVALAAVVALGVSVVACALEVSGIPGEAASTSASSSGAGGGATSSSAGSTASSGAGGSGGSDAVEGTTCLQIRDKAASRQPSRVYVLDPDGPGGEDPFKAYCEMIEDAGGWTLALKIDGEKDTFEYNQKVWEDSEAHRPDFPDLDEQEAKLKSFSTISFKEVRLGMIENKIPRWIVVPLAFGAAPSLEELVRNSDGVTTNVMESTWRALVESPSLQQNCKREGFNIVAKDNARARVRIGILGNNEMDCISADSLIGFGADKAHGGPSGNFARTMPDNGDKTTRTFGYVLVR